MDENIQVKWMVCHDGSKSSTDALHEVVQNLVKRGDHMTVAHIWSAAKEKYLKFDMRKNYIRNQCDADCISLMDNYHFVEEELKGESSDIKRMLNDIAV